MCVYILFFSLFTSFLHHALPIFRSTVLCHIRLRFRDMLRYDGVLMSTQIWMLRARTHAHRKSYPPNQIQVHFDDVSLYGTPKEELLPNIQTISEKMSSNFLKNQLQSWFQPTDNRLAMKLFGSKKALVKERIRQKTAGHWVIHPCSSFR